MGVSSRRSIDLGRFLGGTISYIPQLKTDNIQNIKLVALNPLIYIVYVGGNIHVM